MMTGTLARSCLAGALWLGMAQAADAAAPGAAAEQNFIVNGDAETLDAGGALNHWSLYVRQGQATLQQTTASRTQGKAAARLEIPHQGAIFNLRTGSAAVPRLPSEATYLFSADVKYESDDISTPPGYFAVGNGADLQVGHLRPQAGWQKVSLYITVPAQGEIRRLDFSGGSKVPVVVFIDNVRLQPAQKPAETHQAHPLETAIKLQPGVPLLVRKVLPTDCRLVRAFTHAPIDGRVDTRYATGAVSEWSGRYGESTIDYRAFNGNNGLHVTLAEGGFNALQIRGGWQGRLYADVDGLTPPESGAAAVCDIQPQTDVFRRMFDPQVQARRLSFFYHEEHRRPLADMTFLRVTPGATFKEAGDKLTLHLGEPAVPDETIGQALAARFEGESRAHQFGAQPGPQVALKQNQFLHVITPPQDVSAGVGAITLQLHVAQIERNSVLTVRVQDVLDARREAMGVDFQVPGPGVYTVTLDVPDQVFLPPRESWSQPPRLEGPIAPPPVLWLSLAAEAPMTLKGAQVTLHRVPREQALLEAGAWRKLLLQGLFKTMSEPRPWMNLDNKTPLREQMANKDSLKRYTALPELLENAEIARLLLPDDDVVRQYHEWLYQSVAKPELSPPARLEQPADAPAWAVAIRAGWREVNHIATWWLDHRMAPNGEFGGNIADDTDLFQTWQCLPMIESAPLGERLKDASAKLAQLCWDLRLEEGINKRTMDGLHAYEEGVNQLALNAWWFYGDPVHFARAMISARSVAKLMVETDDGRLHFPSNYVGIKQMREGYENIGATPGDARWAPVRFLLHPLYVVGLYNRNPLVLERFERWGQTWADYQKPGAYVGQVDIPTGKPTIVSKLPSATAHGPVQEWLALYHLTADPKWQEPFKLLMDSGGYWGTTVQYGRSPHALVDWGEPHQQKMRERFGKADGYAGFFLSKDRSRLAPALAESVAWYSRFRHMHTAAEQKTDRVLTYKATDPIACYLGDAPNRNRWVNLGAVSYEELRGEDFAALVWDAGPEKLRVAFYNFTDQPLAGRARVWRLDHGHYRVRLGADTDDDGALDQPFQERTVQLQRYSPIELTLPPRQVTILDVEQVQRLDDIVERADLALSPIDTVLQPDGTLEVKVHNIGAKPARDVRVALLRGGRVVATQTIREIAAPLDLEPKIVVLRFLSAQAGDEVVVDPEDAIPEIAEHNNRLTVEAPMASSASSTAISGSRAWLSAGAAREVRPEW